MTNPSVSRTTLDNFELVAIDTGPLSLSLLPELGGKLTSLRDARTGREWLWRNPRIGYERVPYGASYVQVADTGGWDECFPTVAPCDYPSAPWQGAHLQDHGELWSQPTLFELLGGGREVGLYTRWEGVMLPYSSERTITLSAGSARIRFEYAVHSHADAPLQFIWSAHPLLAIEPGMSLRLPPAATFNCGSSIPADLFPADSGLRFPSQSPAAPSHPAEGQASAAGTSQSAEDHAPAAGGGVNLASLPDAGARIALKLWSDPLAEGWAALRARDGELRMSWDPVLLPQVGFWINLGAWAGDGGAPYYNLGLEPCMGAQDSLAEAVQRKLFGSLPPHGSRAWWLEVELSDQHGA